MYVIIWEYQVKVDLIAQFEENYSASGAWARLFQKSKGYLGTELLVHEESPGRYITIDRWASPQDYALFLLEWESEYADLDARSEGLTEQETLLGMWETH